MTDDDTGGPSRTGSLAGAYRCRGDNPHRADGTADNGTLRAGRAGDDDAHRADSPGGRPRARLGRNDGGRSPYDAGNLAGADRRDGDGTDRSGGTGRLA